MKRQFMQSALQRARPVFERLRRKAIDDAVLYGVTRRGGFFVPTSLIHGIEVGLSVATARQTDLLLRYRERFYAL